MSEIVKPQVFGIVVVLIFALALSVPVVAAQQPGQPAPSGLLAVHLNAANSVFVSNGKGESVANEKSRDDQAGASFYAAMKRWNRYHLAIADTDAGLLMQISLEKSQVRLTILDANTGAVLASLVEPVENGRLFGTGGKSLDQATSALVEDLRRAMIQRAMPVTPSAAPARANGSQRPKVFLSNVGSNDDLYSGIGMSSGVGWGQAFNKFYAAVQSSRQYELVSSPADADFIFEMSYADPQTTTTESQDAPGCNNNLTTICDHINVEITTFHPQLHLVILDARTLAVQGTFTELIKAGYYQTQRDARFSQALNSLVNNACRQLGRPPTAIFISGVVNVAPVPPQIKAAKTVFISNTAGTDIYGGTPSAEQAYNEFYATMKSWGGYQLSPTPAGADLIFEISANSQFRVAILDPQTSVILWGFTADVKIAVLKSNAQKNFDHALVTLVQNIATLAGRPAVAISVPPSVEAAPVPPQISTAKTVFIANGGVESLSDVKGKTFQAYNDFYATMKSWGRYELAPTASQADLVFQMSLAGSTIYLSILDSKTHVELWGLKQNIRWVFRRTVQQKDLNDAIAALVKNIAKLSGQPAAEISVPAGINTAPVPSRISGSRKVFLSRPREESAFFEEQAPDQLYNQCYADMKSWGQYELTTPGEADLIFEPSVTGGWVSLTIRDAKTRGVLWTFIQPVKIAFLNSNARKNYIAAIGLLMDDVRRVAALSAQPSSANAAKSEE